MPFQTFDAAATPPEDIEKRLATLRDSFDSLGVDGVVVPHEDAYQSEYLPASEERLQFISGFTGSAGRAYVLRDAAMFVTDGRYTLQASAQVPPSFHIASDPAAAKAWAREHLAGITLGVDPHLHSRNDLERIAKQAEGLTLVKLDHNPVDAVWPARPAPPRGQVRAHPAHLAGRTMTQKIADVRAAMDADALFIADSDSVSWLLNWRGADVAHTPLVLARAFVPKEGEVTVFVDPEKVPDEIVADLAGHATIAGADDLLARLATLSAGKTVAADPARTSDAVLSTIESAGTPAPGNDPVQRLKAIKNPAEIAGMRAAHLRDGVAMVRFLAWCEAHAVGATEIDLVRQLEDFRREAGATDISFDTISGSGPHGAIVHYRVDETTDRVIAAGEPVLIDCGGQFEDGTTDITRTFVAGGDPGPDDFRIQYTRVLKGHIAVARQRFPEGALGSELDPLARMALWRAGHDFKHGTGHGIGAALAVHEGPASISRRGTTALEPGMILSNEPGDYHTGAFGIRIENVCLVREARVPPGGVFPMHWFETLTLAPIDTRPIVTTHMTAGEIGWLDAYHARVRGALVDALAPAERDWLEVRTRPVA
ncbi:aminopeptidase P family protein [Acuticoccus sp. I52.16.1]|uniref:aminopeptidase P family protein n=1 Tax=Acuticoccus sp. I52.16.1 TaxID=2928472 RepID=UPI001FD4F8A0|nr:aminopeptidase P family protein [Acuticoccus sp. I52.16.1]UOM35097.1 aminopeptidase P family protein [Acuticoccus sp. I52.16.1]